MATQIVATNKDLPKLAPEGTIYSIMETRQYVKFINGEWIIVADDLTPDEIKIEIKKMGQEIKQEIIDELNL